MTFNNPWDPGKSTMEIKKDRFYTKDHEWAKLNDDGTYTIGVTQFAVDQLGDITLVNIDVSVGDNIQSGQPFGTVESVKTLSDLFCPITGVVKEINTALDDQPELINESVWDNGWMIIIEPTEDIAIMSPEEYEKEIS